MWLTDKHLERLGLEEPGQPSEYHNGYYKIKTSDKQKKDGWQYKYWWEHKAT